MMAWQVQRNNPRLCSSSGPIFFSSAIGMMIPAP